MKTFIWLIAFFAALLVSSCQGDEDTVVQDTTNNFSKTAPISSLIKRVVQYETTADNVIDGTSNCSMKLPLWLIVNGQYVYVIDSDGYQEVEDAKNNYPGDDVVHFAQFPVTMIYPDYSEYQFSSEQQWNYIFSHYGDDSAFREIKCLDFNFPVHVNLYNTDNQVASTVTINGNEQLYSFIDGLNDSQIVGFAFPITMHKSNGQLVTINTNLQLEAAIDDAVNACATGTGTTPISDIISGGTWHVSYYYSFQNETSYYTGYTFTFSANGDAVAIKNATTINGDWDLQYGSGPDLSHLDLHFDGSQLDHLESNWDVMEYTETYLRLRREVGGGGGPQCYYLDFTKN